MKKKNRKKGSFVVYETPVFGRIAASPQTCLKLNCYLLQKFFFYTARSLSVGTRTGYKLYSLNSLNDKPDLLFEKGETHDYHDSNACPSSCDNYVVSFLHVKMAAKCVSSRDYSPVV